jgi:transposase
MLKYSVGIDISAKSLDAAVSVIDEQQKVEFKSAKSKIPNTQEGFKILVSWIEKNHKEKSVPLVACMEATGVYYENCSMYLHRLGYRLSVILPNKSKKYMQSLGIKSKNDKIDSKGLAQMGAEQCLKQWNPLSEFYHALRSLTRQHQSLQELKTGVSNQLHAIKNSMYKQKIVEKQLTKTIQLIEKQVEELETAIHSHIQSDEQVCQKVENICKIKGLGILTAAVIIAETNGFELFENAKQVVSYAGYDAIENQSGMYFGKTRISKKGNSRIRRALYMPAFAVVKWEQNIFANLYQRTFAKHGIKMKSYVAVQKKLLTVIYALWKKNEAFDSNYRQNDKINIRKEEQELTSRLGSERTEKNSQTICLAIQGKHPVRVHSLLPLGSFKSKKIIAKI